MLKGIILCILISKSQDTPGQQTDQQGKENSEYEWDRIGGQARTLFDKEANWLL
jgi:hypothetical protein